MTKTKQVNTLEEVRQVVQGIVLIKSRSADRESACAFILDTPVHFWYRQCGKRDKGLLKACMANLTSLPRG